MPKNLINLIVWAVLALIVAALICYFWAVILVILALIGLGALVQWLSK